jgi:DNA polymerase III epsilon subunit-like protein
MNLVNLSNKRKGKEIMNYVVFDLEWNQSPNGKKFSNSRLPFEIIEIGAVKLNQDKEVTDTFHRLIKPQVYNWIHDNIREVIHVDYQDLADGIPFPQAAREFIEWCGDDWVFFTWGNQDVMELQRNMKYYELLSLLPGPITFYDVQKLFSIRYEDHTSRRSLEYAIDFLHIEKSHGFHRALEDAHFTAKVLCTLKDEDIFPHPSLDVYQNPKRKRDEIFMTYPTYTRYVSREFPNREKVTRDREVISTRCPVCNHLAKRRVRWFINNSKVFYSLSECKEHGYFIGKIRIRKTDEDQCFAIKTQKLATIEEAEEIRQRHDSLRQKRQLKRRLDKEV